MREVGGLAEDPHRHAPVPVGGGVVEGGDGVEAVAELAADSLQQHGHRGHLQAEVAVGLGADRAEQAERAVFDWKVPAHQPPVSRRWWARCRTAAAESGEDCGGWSVGVRGTVTTSARSTGSMGMRAVLTS
ncbi:hypothetical protein ACFWOK_14980 [Streptomyces sindenensis]|uniref:Uncharacterized protein n=1 Tax=Streptomyces sindenensis TaxID=67363 RepID=A0ABW6ENI2_9ACTN